MNNKFIGILLLLAGLAAGGSAVYLYSKTTEPKKEAPAEAKAEKKILYYRNPMNPEVTSPSPMKDPMGMDYVPVYEDEAPSKDEAPGAVRITTEKIQQIGVRSEEVRHRSLKRVIRTVGRVEPVENKIFVINAKVSGWVEKLHVSKTDQMVATGERLLELYSPDLISAQEEYLLALKSLERMKDSPPEVRSGAESLLNAARQRLKYWDISDDQIKKVASTGAVTRTMTIRAPSNGSVTEKMVVEGQKIEAGEPLFKIIDHSVVWVYGEIYEYEMPYIKIGQSAALTPSYSPSEAYEGKIEHVYSHLGSIRYVPEEGTEVRTAKVRFVLPNTDHKLKLGMYLNVEISARVAKEAIAVPDSAVIDSGTRQVVIIDRRDGTFEPRAIETGVKGEEYYEVKSGVKEGEWVVTSANFLIDSESNLKAAITGLGAHEHGAKVIEDKKEAEPAASHKGH
ncbi:MAG: efflux RND transporter periplasmic adaptor subunit [Deltaproteobacteria bacterium]|nr:efflux RND transporter periplasmic adaptor subunit [Deltaproteobacteria bacterium]